MELDELKERLHCLFNPESDEDGPYREFGHPRLSKEHGLDTSYLETMDWEGSTTHPYTRLCSPGDTDLHKLTRNSDVSIRLFEAGLRLFAESIITYHGQAERTGQLRYYPPVILTFWSGFETFVRYASELMLITVQNVPEPIANFLRELEVVVDRHGLVKTRERHQPVLDRYAVLLRQGYGFEVDRGTGYWQRLQAARELRDYYTHLDVTEPRAIASADVLGFLESVLLGLIYPSVQD